jgi:hypothetical protein
MQYKVTCSALGTEVDLAVNYPEGATDEMIRAADEQARLWFQDYMRGEVGFLCEQALDLGFRFHSTLAPEERGPYRFIRQFGADILCRHGKYFVNAADENDHRMVDDHTKVVLPINRKAELTAKENADKVVAPKNITVEGQEG